LANVVPSVVFAPHKLVNASFDHFRCDLHFASIAPVAGKHNALAKPLRF